MRAVLRDLASPETWWLALIVLPAFVIVLPVLSLLEWVRSR